MHHSSCSIRYKSQQYPIGSQWTNTQLRYHFLCLRLQLVSADFNGPMYANVSVLVSRAPACHQLRGTGQLEDLRHYHRLRQLLEARARRRVLGLSPTRGVGRF